MRATQYSYKRTAENGEEEFERKKIRRRETLTSDLPKILYTAVVESLYVNDDV